MSSSASGLIRVCFLWLCTCCCAPADPDDEEDDICSDGSLPIRSMQGNMVLTVSCTDGSTPMPRVAPDRSALQDTVAKAKIEQIPGAAWMPHVSHPIKAAQKVHKFVREHDWRGRKRCSSTNALNGKH